MAIPLVTMIGMLAYLVVTTVDNAVSIDRAPDLISGTAVPAANFIGLLQDERRAAVVYLSRPTAADSQAYGAAVAATDRGEQVFRQAMSSSATVGSEDGTEAAAIGAVTADLSRLGTLRGAVRHRLMTPLAAFTGYSKGIADEPRLFLAEAGSVTTNVPGAAQSLGIIATAQAREALSQEDALLAGALAAHRMSLAARGAFNQAAAQRQAYLGYADSVLDPADLAAFNAQLGQAPGDGQQLTAIEQAMADGTSMARLGISPAAWQALTSTMLTEYFKGGVNAADALLAADHQTTHTAWVEVGVVSGAGLLGLLVTILVTSLVGRGIIRRLRGLERSALALAENQLPDVIGRLRRGEEVDVAAEAPPLRVGRDEIGRVGQAFHLVQQTAIKAAVDEARLRRGVNDVFRSLARRSQSLLHRQLALLDQMERRATDPEALDDLFRLDHLTTRMRRHAEGLVILAGAPSGRGWSSPVRMVDVMRGAIAEVEDYARVSVATRSQAALSGTAVADVIHLLAELIENAATMSPPYTSVRVSGDTVASGFAIEVEDRGLGMNPQRLAELNERLASPPEFNPSDSEQLGLFVVSQLAKRHGIRVTLRASAYGGTGAIVLIPEHLVVTEEAFRAGLPGQPAAITMAPPASGPQPAPAAPAGPAEPAALAGVSEPGGAAELPRAPGVRISGPLRRSASNPAEGQPRGAGPAAARPEGLAGADVPAGVGSAAPSGTGPAPFDVFAPLRRSQGAGETPPPRAGETPPPPAGEPAYQGHAGAAAPPGAGVPRNPSEPVPFPGWTSPPASVGSRGRAGSAATAPPATPMIPVASPRTPNAPGPPWEVSRQTGPLPVLSEQSGNGDPTGLPRRVRQANLAPQLRADPPRSLTSVTAAASLTGGPTPAEIRQTMSALQRDWEDGRAQRAAGQGPAEPPAAPTIGGESDGT
ncbi:MAG TPA: nitrate- and nitrite sensing domain-containing protein [Streptosporangiaceae bacterium]|nr:nitrate- and nitrite sensing domain-containing protein [Streptosporangiaceae bacterium]